MSTSPNRGLNQYLADQLGLSVDVFDGQGGFWNAARGMGIKDHQINAMISGYDKEFERDGTPKSADAYSNLGIGEGMTQTQSSGSLLADFQSQMSELQNRLTSTFQTQVGSQRDMIEDLRRRLAASSGAMSPAQANALMSARYMQAGRSRANLGSAFGAVSDQGGAAPKAGLIF